MFESSVSQIETEKDVIFLSMNKDIEKEKIFQFYLKNMNSSDSVEFFQKSMMKIINDTRQLDIFNETFIENSSLKNHLSEAKFNVANSKVILILLTVIYVIIFVSGILGNVVTCIVILKNRGMHTAVNYYLGKFLKNELLRKIKIK